MRKIHLFLVVLFLITFCFTLTACGVGSGVIAENPNTSTSKTEPTSEVSKNTYTVSWVNYDGKVLNIDTYNEGAYPVYTGALPYKPEESDRRFEFEGWSPSISAINSNMTYVATYKEIKTLNVEFRNYDGTILENKKVDYGTTPTYTGQTPTKVDNLGNESVFLGWEPSIATIYDNTTYFATFSENSFNISYDLDFGTNDSRNPISYDKNTGIIELYPAKKIGYSFVGWDYEGSIVLTVDTSLAKDIVLTAVWEVDEELDKFEFTSTGNRITINGVKDKTVTEITIPSCVKVIGDNAFEGCTKLKTLTIPSEINKIGKRAFKNCTSLKNIIINPNSNLNLSEQAFDESSIEYVYLLCDETEWSNIYKYNNIDHLLYYYSDNAPTDSGNYWHYVNNKPTIWKFRVKFIVNGGEVSSDLYKYGDYVEAPVDPSIASNETYNYEFIGWDSEVTPCYGEKTYTAVFNPVYIEYDITFINENGSIISTNQYHYGDTIVVPDNPTKPSDNYDDYTFAGWDSEVTPCYGSKTYRATFTSTKIEYEVTFVDYDGTLISSIIYHYGDVISKPNNPERPQDNTYTYEFEGWTPEITPCYGDKTYTATYNSIYKHYDVQFVDYDGRVLTSTGYHYGDNVVLPSDPERISDMQYTYEFAGWTPEITPCYGDKIYTATYSSTLNSYTVRWLNWDGVTLETDENVLYGTTPEYNGETPKKPSDIQYTYTFAGWDKEITSCAGNQEYFATYSNTLNSYTITWLNWDGNLLSTTENVLYGTTPEYNGETPTKASDNEYNYVFAGWDRIVSLCVGDTTYTATFTRDLVEYTIRFFDYDGTLISENKNTYGNGIILPSTPFRDPDNTYIYEFTGWDSEVTPCYGDKDYYATYSSTYIEYSITFYALNYSVLSSFYCHYGDVYEAPSNVPLVLTDVIYRYEFIGWDSEITPCYGSKTYRAQYEEKYVEYSVVFLNYDNTVISSAYYHYNDSITVPDDPTKPSDNYYYYEFAIWQLEGVDYGPSTCQGDAIYTPRFTSYYREYYIQFVDYDNTLLSYFLYHYDDVISVPSNPEKPSDDTYHYIFNSWDSEITHCFGDKTYKATYLSIYNEYNITFRDYNGDDLSVKYYHYGDTVKAPENPSRPSDIAYNYEFVGWDSEVTPCYGDKVYTAIYKTIGVDYVVTFKDYDGRIISTKTYKFGDTIEVPENPTRLADNTYTYEFIDWGSEIDLCYGDLEYVANYSSTYIDYAVYFLNYDTSIISYATYHYGDTIVFPSNPIRSDEMYTYEFMGWDNNSSICNGNMTYNAIYRSTYIDYLVKFVDYNDEVISQAYYHYYDVVNVPDNPKRLEDVVYTYEFTGWDNEITLCFGNTVYKATYSSTYIDYTITFANYDGTVVSSKQYHYYDTIEIPDVIPVRPADNTYTYEFDGWEGIITPCYGDKTYTAIFRSIYIPYTITFKGLNGVILSEDIYYYGWEPSCNPPLVVVTNEKIYSFVSWNSEIVPCDGNKVYTAIYSSEYIEYTIEFRDYNGGLIQEGTYHYLDDVIPPANPVREPDTEYEYTFAGWNPEVTTCDGNKTYYANYTPSYREYLIVFEDYDGTILSSNYYHYNDSITLPTNPSREADLVYRYEFSRWYTVVTPCYGDTTYTAIYDSIYIEYTIRFVNYNGSLLDEMVLHYGDTVTPPQNPIKPENDTYTYEFAGWDNEVVLCDGNMTYTALFNPVYKEFTVVFEDYDGTVISSKIYHYGDNVLVPSNLTRESDSAYDYEFAGWNNIVTPCYGNVIYIAQYTMIRNNLVVTFKDYDGSVISTKTYREGNTVTLPISPTRPNDLTYSYVFIGWDREVELVYSDATYYAQYSASYIYYIVSFVDYDNSIISSNSYHYGETILVPDNPTRASNETYTYNYIGWDKVITTCDGEKTYSAVYEEKYIEYTIRFVDYDGTIIYSGIYHYNDAVNMYAPTRQKDNVYTYEFIGWTPEVTPCYGDETYTATYRSIYRNYEIIFQDYGYGSYSSEYYHYGDIVVVPENPTRESDYMYGYTFVEWDNEVTPCYGEMVYTAVFSSYLREYTIKFVDYDGTLISENKYHYFDEIEVPDSPKRENYMGRRYDFSGWDTNIFICYGDRTYEARYLESLISYSVFYDLDGGLNNENNVDYYDCETSNFVLFNASKAGHNFLGWVYNDSVITEIDTSLLCDINLTATWEEKDELSNFIYTIGEYIINEVRMQLVNILGVKDNTIKDIYIPDYVYLISSGAFENCDDIESIEIGNMVEELSNRLLYNKTKLNNVILHDGLKIIESSAFYGCTSLESIVIPDSVTSIGDSSFYGCTSLESIELSSGLLSIGNSVFFECSLLDNINIPNSVNYIGTSAFSFCSTLANITLPNNLSTITSNMFSQCSSLSSLTIPNTVSIIDTNAFASSGIENLIIPENVVRISENAFYYCEQLASVTILGESLKNIDDSAFWCCTSLAQINIPSSVEEIGKYAFNNCWKISSITIPEGITEIKESLFYNCKKLEFVSLPSTLLSIGEGAFSFCVLLNEIVLPEGLTAIGKTAFHDTSALKSINLPSGITCIEDETFWASGLESIVLHENIVSVGVMAFQACSKLKTVVISGATVLNDHAFWDCEKLTSLTISNSLELIGELTLGYLIDLEKITYLGTIDEWNLITKDEKWNWCSPFTIIECSNGNVTLELE